jgi:hypothetical protein
MVGLKKQESERNIGKKVEGRKLADKNLTACVPGNRMQPFQVSVLEERNGTMSCYRQSFKSARLRDSEKKG